MKKIKRKLPKLFKDNKKHWIWIAIATVVLLCIILLMIFVKGNNPEDGNNSGSTIETSSDNVATNNSQLSGNISTGNSDESNMSSVDADQGESSADGKDNSTNENEQSQTSAPNNDSESGSNESRVNESSTNNESSTGDLDSKLNAGDSEQNSHDASDPSTNDNSKVDESSVVTEEEDFSKEISDDGDQEESSADNSQIEDNNSEKAEDSEQHIHNYIQEIITEATCQKDGVAKYTCECGDSYTEALAFTGHNISLGYDFDKLIGPGVVMRFAMNTCPYCNAWIKATATDEMVYYYIVDWHDPNGKPQQSHKLYTEEERDTFIASLKEQGIRSGITYSQGYEVWVVEWNFYYSDNY